jgi:arsenate reductase-like glutaredoxin family protein
MGPWELGGLLIVDGFGRPIECAVCPCAGDPEEPSIPCGGTLSFGGGETYPSSETIGLGTETGIVVMNVDAVFVPDRYIMYYNDSVVIDTGYMGAANRNIIGSTVRNSFTNSLLGRVDPITGNTYPFLNEMHLADGYPKVFSNATGTRGVGTFSFNKETTFPTTARIDVYGPQPGTVWSCEILCPDPTISIEDAPPSVQTDLPPQPDPVPEETIGVLKEITTSVLINNITINSKSSEPKISPMFTFGLPLDITISGYDYPIYYTLDGSEPTINSTEIISETQITITEDTVVKAFSFNPIFQLPSDVVIANFADPSVNILSTVSVDNIDWEEINILPNQTPTESLNTALSVNNIGWEEINILPNQTPTESLNTALSVDNIDWQEINVISTPPPTKSLNTALSVDNIGWEEITIITETPTESLDTALFVDNIDWEEINVITETPTESLDTALFVDNIDWEEINVITETPTESLNTSLSVDNIGWEEITI